MACYHAKWRLAQTTRIFKHSLTELLAWLIFFEVLVTFCCISFHFYHLHYFKYILYVSHLLF